MHRPAVIVACDADTMTVSLQVFCDGNKEIGDQIGNMFYWKNAPHDPQAARHGTWHWPEEHAPSPPLEAITTARKHD